MSGGSFDYLYSLIENDNPLTWYTLELLEKMADWLNEPEQNQPSAATEIKRIHAELSNIKKHISEIAQNRPFLDLLKEAEWWCSHDVGQDDFESEWAKYEAQHQPHPTWVAPWGCECGYCNISTDTECYVCHSPRPSK